MNTGRKRERKNPEKTVFPENAVSMNMCLLIILNIKKYHHLIEEVDAKLSKTHITWINIVVYL